MVGISENDLVTCFCRNYSKLDAVTNLDSSLLSRTEALINILVEATVLSTLDASSMYLQIEIEECDRDRKLVTSLHGLC